MLLQDGYDLLFRKPTTLHVLVLKLGQNELQTGLNPGGKVDAYRDKVAALRDALYQEDTRAEAFEILRGLIEKVVIHDRPGQTPEIELIGDIATMVEISMQGPETTKAAHVRAAFDEKTVRSVKMVAGTGFEPVTFRL